MRDNRSSWVRMAAACAVAIVVVAAGAASAAEAQAFRFAVIGDTRIPGLPDRSNQFEQPQVFLDAIREINLLDYDLVLDVGDLILGNADQTADIERMWDSFDAAWRQFAMPAKIVAGNHDIWNAASNTIYRRRYGDPTYSFDMASCHFIVLNSDDAPNDVDYIRGKQLEWLKDDLEAHKDAAHIFVFLHKPLWTSDARQSNWKADVHPLLVKYGVDAVFAGHDHRYQEYGPFDGVRHFIAGGGGAELGGGPAEGGFFHHMAVSVRGHDVRYAVVRTGNVLSTDAVSERSLAAIEALREGLKDAAVAIPGVNQPFQILLVARNEHSAPLQGSVVWKAPGSWRIEPAAVPLTLRPGESASLTFTATVNDPGIFPVPECTLTAWWGPGAFSTDSRPLTILNDWFLRQWMVIGPFELWPEGEKAGVEPPGFTKAYPPELAVDLSQRYQGAAGEVAWTPVAAGADGYVDLRAHVQPSHQMVAYAVTTVTAKRSGDALLTLGSNDGAKLWVNGSQVYSKHIGRGAQPHEELLHIKLREGPNQVLLKVENWGAAWGFYVAIVDLDGTLVSRQP